jgi:hypothetical protein
LDSGELERDGAVVGHCSQSLVGARCTGWCKEEAMAPLEVGKVGQLRGIAEKVLPVVAALGVAGG